MNPSFALWIPGGIHHVFAEPQSYTASFPSSNEVTLTQGGFFLPIDAPDDIEAVVSVGWDALSSADLDVLLTAQSQPMLDFADPLDLMIRGYVKSLDHETLTGRTGQDGLPMYSVQLSLQGIHLVWPAVLGQLRPNHTYMPGDSAGIIGNGGFPAEFEGSATQVDAEGWGSFVGGNTLKLGIPLAPHAVRGSVFAAFKQI